MISISSFSNVLSWATVIFFGSEVEDNQDKEMMNMNEMKTAAFKNVDEDGDVDLQGGKHPFYSQPPCWHTHQERQLSLEPYNVTNDNFEAETCAPVCRQVDDKDWCPQTQARAAPACLLTLTDVRYCVLSCTSDLECLVGQVCKHVYSEGGQNFSGVSMCVWLKEQENSVIDGVADGAGAHDLADGEGQARRMNHDYNPMNINNENNRQEVQNHLDVFYI